MDMIKQFLLLSVVSQAWPCSSAWKLPCPRPSCWRWASTSTWPLRPGCARWPPSPWGPPSSLWPSPCPVTPCPPSYTSPNTSWATWLTLCSLCTSLRSACVGFNSPVCLFSFFFIFSLSFVFLLFFLRFIAGSGLDGPWGLVRLMHAEGLFAQVICGQERSDSWISSWRPSTHNWNRKCWSGRGSTALLNWNNHVSSGLCKLRALVYDILPSTTAVI